MTFKNLTEEQKQHIKNVYAEKSEIPWEKKAFLLGEEFGVSERTIRRWCSENLGLKEKVDVETEQYANG